MEVTDRSFELSQTINYTLSIRFTSGGFCFIVFNRRNKKILHFSEITGKDKDPKLLLKEHASTNPVLQCSFEEILCIWDTPLYTLLPNSIFSEENISLFWELNFGENNPDELNFFSDKLKLPEIVNVYAIPAEYVALLKEIFPSIQFMNQQSVQIIYSLFENKKKNNLQVFIQIHTDFFDALVVEKGKVILANSYHFQSKDEFLYFSINLFEQLQLDSRSTEVVLLGEKDEKGAEGEKADMLRKYIRTVNSEKITTDVSGLNLKKIPNLEQHINLFNLPLCVS